MLVAILLDIFLLLLCEHLHAGEFFCETVSSNNMFLKVKLLLCHLQECSHNRLIKDLIKLPGIRQLSTPPDKNKKDSLALSVFNVSLFTFQQGSVGSALPDQHTGSSKAPYRGAKAFQHTGKINEEKFNKQCRPKEKHVK